MRNDTAGGRTRSALLSPRELRELEEQTNSRIAMMSTARLAVLEAWFGTTPNRTNAEIARKLGKKPRAMMAVTRRTIRECRAAAADLWEKARWRADSEWGPACHDETMIESVKATLERQDPEAPSAKIDHGMLKAARRLLPLILKDVLDRSSRYGIAANSGGRTLAAAIQKAARRPRPHSIVPIDKLLQAAGVQIGSHAWNVIRWAGYETSGDYVIVRDGNRPRIQVLLAMHPEGIKPEAIQRATGIPLQRIRETLRNDRHAVRSRPGTWTLATPGKTPFTNATDAIKAVITQAGGRASEDHIVHELEKRYGIRPGTTRTCARFRDFRSGPEGIELNPAAEAWSGDMADRASGFSDAGDPYIDWHARGNRSQRRDLRIHDIPEAIADHVGSRPNETRLLPVTSPATIEDVTLTWSTASQAPVTLRRMAAVLKALGTERNDLIRITFSRKGSVSFQNLGQADRTGQPESSPTPRTYAQTGKGPASRVLNEGIRDVLSQHRWAINTAAARCGVERHLLYSILNGAETTLDRAETACLRLGIEMRIGVRGPAATSCEQRGRSPVQRASEQLREHLEAKMQEQPGSSYREVAERLGVPKSWVQTTLRGHVPRIDRAHRLAEVLDTTIILGETTKNATYDESESKDDERSTGTARPRLTRRQRNLLQNAARTLENRPEALREPRTADGIPSMEETGYVAGHIVRNKPESRRKFNEGMAALRKEAKLRFDADDPDIVNGAVIEAAKDALDVAVMPVLFLTNWPKRWAGTTGVGTQGGSVWTPDAEETRAVLAAVADGRIEDALDPWWTDEQPDSNEKQG